MYKQSQMWKYILVWLDFQSEVSLCVILLFYYLILSLNNRIQQ